MSEKVTPAWERWERRDLRITWTAERRGHRLVYSLYPGEYRYVYAEDNGRRQFQAQAASKMLQHPMGKHSFTYAAACFWIWRLHPMIFDVLLVSKQSAIMTHIQGSIPVVENSSKRISMFRGKISLNQGILLMFPAIHIGYQSLYQARYQPSSSPRSPTLGLIPSLMQLY